MGLSGAGFRMPATSTSATKVWGCVGNPLANARTPPGPTRQLKVIALEGEWPTCKGPSLHQPKFQLYYDYDLGGKEEEFDDGRQSGMANQLPRQHAKAGSGGGSSKTSKPISSSDQNGEASRHVRTNKMAPGCVDQHTSCGGTNTSKAIPLSDRNREASGHVLTDTRDSGWVAQHASGEQRPGRWSRRMVKPTWQCAQCCAPQ